MSSRSIAGRRDRALFSAYNPIKLTDYTITDEAELRDILVETRNKGHMITVDQLDIRIYGTHRGAGEGTVMAGSRSVPSVTFWLYAAAHTWMN